MNTSTLRSAAALLGAIILSVTLGGQPALAYKACPCLTGDLVDELFGTLGLSVDQPGQKVACVDDPGFITFDYFDRAARGGRSIYIDVTYPTGRTQARCTVDLSHVANDFLTESRVEITNAEARACRKQIVKSRVWRRLGCPNN